MERRREVQTAREVKGPGAHGGKGSNCECVIFTLELPDGFYSGR